MVFNLIQSSVAASETQSLLATPIYSQENVEHQRHSTRRFSTWQNWPLGKEMPIPQLLTELQSIRKWIKQDCHILPRQDKIVLKSSLPLKMVCQLR